MNAKLEKIREKFKNNEPVFGFHIFLREPDISEAVGNLNYDFLWIEGEHTAIDRTAIHNHIMAMNGTNAACFVRVPWNDPVLVKPVVDMGPDGIIFPMICSAEDARLAVASCEYPPKGIRGFGPLRAAKYGLIGNTDYIASASRDCFKIIQIEHINALKEIDAILEVEGIDMVVFGPNDLSGSMGKLVQVRDPEVMDVMDQFAAACVRHKMPFGVSMGSIPENMQDWVRRGANFLSLDGDISSIMSGAQATFAKAQAAFGLKSDSEIKRGAY